MWQRFCQNNNIDENTPHDQWKFCGGGPFADELTNLALQGIKTATASAKIAFENEHEPIPAVVDTVVKEIKSNSKRMQREVKKKVKNGKKN